MDLDPYDDQILMYVYEGKTMEEMRETGLSSTNTILLRIRKLEELGLVVPPPSKNRPRGRRLSKSGIDYLLRRGYTTQRKAQIYQEYHAVFSQS